jgi:hypothetical protein
VRIWRSYGVIVVISVADITTRNGVAALLSDANKLGPVDAIFNLAVVITDLHLNAGLSSHLLSKGIKIKIYGTIILI